MSTFQSPSTGGNSPAPTPGFAVSPLHIAIAKAWQQQLFSQAFQQTLAFRQMPAYHRRIISSWN